MTSPVSIPFEIRDSLDKLHELAERILALCMVASNQSSPESIPPQFTSAYFDQMGDLASEVLGVTHRLDADIRYTARPPAASSTGTCDRAPSPRAIPLI